MKQMAHVQDSTQKTKYVVVDLGDRLELKVHLKSYLPIDDVFSLESLPKSKVFTFTNKVLSNWWAKTDNRFETESGKKVFKKSPRLKGK